MADSNSNGTNQERTVEARRYALVIEWSDEDQVFIASAPDLPGMRTHGATREEALTMGEEAIELWIGACRRAGRAVPPARFSAMSYQVRPEANVRELAAIG